MGSMVSLVRTALLNALYSSTGDCLVDGLGSILDSLYGALPRDGCGAEETGLASNLLTEHIGGLLCGVCFRKVDLLIEVKEVAVDLLDDLLDEFLASARQKTALKDVDVD
jgi:hypothetical protein